MLDKNKQLYLREAQILLLNDIWGHDEVYKNTKALIGHRRCGKTIAEVLVACQFTNYFLKEEKIFKLRGDVDSHNPVISYIAPTKVQAKDIIWKDAKFFLGQFTGAKVKEQTLSITIPRPLLGDVIEFKLFASKYHDRIRGTNSRLILFDEVQDSPVKALSDSIEPCLKDTAGHLVISGTAKGEDHLYDLVKLYISLGLPVYLLPVTMTNVFTREEILQFKRESVGGSFEREYMVNFSHSVEGSFFAERMAELEKDKGAYFSSYYDPSKSIVFACDIGVGEGFSGWVAQIQRDGEIINILDYYEGYEELYSLRTDLEADGYLPDIIITPFDVNTKRLGGFKVTTNRDIFKQIFPECIIKACKQTGNKMADIENVARHLHCLRFPSEDERTDAHIGRRKLKEFCRKRDPNTNAPLDTIDKSKGNDHAADAMRYLFTGLKFKDGKARVLPTFKARGQREVSEKLENLSVLGYSGSIWS